jgi:DNA-binding beta-propeller fold protein YncE
MSRLPISIVGGTLAAAALAACSSSAPGPQPTGTQAQASLDLRKVPQTSNPYTLFETLQVRPLALSPDGRLLFAANTPDNRLEIFEVRRDGLRSIGSVVVGLEPVALAVRSDREVWVVNHLSDSVSIVDVGDPTSPRVSRTLLVGDEPRDIVFAGPDHDRAFITTAHRGQNSPDDPDLFVPGGRADVWVFDASHLGAAPGGTRLAKLTLFADTPRALTASPDGKTVYAAAFFSGNQTTAVSEDAVSQVYGGVMPGPAAIDLGGNIIPQPPTGLIVKWKVGQDGNFHWIDAYGSVFDPFVRVSLPDQDVFAIDATATPPVATTSFAHVGTTLFNMAVNPKTGKVYVSNTDAHNDVRFEGHTPGFTSVAGNLVDSRISVLDPSSGSVLADNLNTHLNHATGTGNPALSVAFPQDLAVSRDGKSLYVVAQGSSKVAVYDTAALESGAAPPSAANQVTLTGGGPTGVVLDEAQGVALVLTRFDDSISVVDLRSRKETAHVAMFSPEPASVTAGRQYLYNATATSALGDQACASCHIGGDFDGLAWDLGNPGNIPLGITTNAAAESDIHTIPEAFIAALIGAQQAAYVYSYYQPCKGPMTTQSLRGLDNHGAMHWRGDRNGAVQQNGAPFLDGNGNPVVSAQPNSGIFDEFNAFVSFNVAFPGLVGNAAQLSATDMSDFATFMLQATYPPNPIRALDDSLTPSQQAGQSFYFNQAPGVPELPVDRFHNCNGCHTLDRNGNLGATAHPGFFGTDGRLSFENETQTFKVPHLRNAYQKIGMFGSSLDSVHAIGSLVPPLNPPVAGVRGFGFQHDGADGKLEDFFTAFVFVQTTVTVTFQGLTVPPNPYGIPLFANPADPLNPANGISTAGLALRQNIADFVFAFDSNLFPIVGQQVTVARQDAAAAAPRVALLESQAAAGATDLVAHASIFGQAHGFVWSQGTWIADVSWLPPLTDADLQTLAGFTGVTYLAVPPGEGWRVGIDRDADGYADGDEVALGTDPASPASHP